MFKTVRENFFKIIISEYRVKIRENNIHQNFNISKNKLSYGYAT